MGGKWMRTLRVILASGALTAAAVTGLAPAASATPATAGSCPAGYTKLYVTNGGQDYYLDAEGIGNTVEVTDTPTCWHPGDSGSYSYITDNSGNCLDWDNGGGYVTMAACDKAVSEYWYTTAEEGGYLLFANKYALKHFPKVEYLLAAGALQDGSGVGLNDVVNAYSEWFRIDTT
jgi:hypothetical protein